jgi:Lrp/AsnC family leucine-responsive transcriptional regulator
MDERDREISAVLAANGRATFAEIGQRVGLAASSVHDRIRRLERAGAITGYRATFDAGALGLPITALVSVRPLDPRAPDDIPERVAALPEIEACYSIAGEFNYMLLVRTVSTAELERFLQRLREHAEVHSMTTIVLSTAFEGRPPILSP